MGIRFFPIVGWAERGGSGASEPGNSVPRFHLTWGTGPAILAPFIQRLHEHLHQGRIRVLYRHRVTSLILKNTHVNGVTGEILTPTNVARGETSSRVVVTHFEMNAPVVVIATGGIGGNHELVRKHWPTNRLGAVPAFMVAGVPAYVDGYLQSVLAQQGASVINSDRMWHYTEGLRNWNPVWPHHGIRILPGPSSLWLDPNGERLPFPHYPGCNTLATLSHITQHGFPYTWFLLNRAIIKKEFALSGSEQNPDITQKNKWLTLKRIGKGLPAPVQAFMQHGADFVVKDNLPDLVNGMNALIGNDAISLERIASVIHDRDLQVKNKASKDTQCLIVHGARAYFSERLIRVVKPAPLLNPGDDSLIAVKLNILTRKSLGGLETDLKARVLNQAGDVIPGLFAVGEVAGFGGGGMHGYRALEGSFLGGCLFTAKVAADAIING